MLSAPSFAKDDPREAALRKAELARFDANITADAKVLGELLADDLEYTHSNGDLDTKASFIESLTSGKRDYLATTASIESVRFFGDVAVIRGKAKVTVADDGQSRDLDLRYLDIWSWKNGRWQMTAWQSARMPPAASATPVK
jgi:ketosteroid isomerase-like protein